MFHIARLRRAQECDQQKPRHVKGSQQRHPDRENEQQQTAMLGIERRGDDFVLAEETAEGGHAAEREGRERKRPKGHRHFVL